MQPFNLEFWMQSLYFCHHQHQCVTGSDLPSEQTLCLGTSELLSSLAILSKLITYKKSREEVAQSHAV